MYNAAMADHFKITQSLSELPKRVIIELGQALGLSLPKLQKMENLPSDMVYAWLLRQDRVLNVGGEPTKTTLAAALKSISQLGVADKVEKLQLDEHRQN